MRHALCRKSYIRKPTRQCKLKEKLHFFSERLQKLMDDRNINQSDLAKIAGVSHVSARDWVKGKIPKTEYFHRIADYFKVSMEWLLTGQDTSLGAVPVHEGSKRTARDLRTAMKRIQELEAENRDLKGKIDLARKTLMVLTKSSSRKGPRIGRLDADLSHLEDTDAEKKKA